MTGARGLGILFMTVALGIYLGVTAPARDEEDLARQQISRIESERRDAARQLADLEKRAQLLRRAGLLETHLALSPEKAIQRVRGQVVRCLRDAGVGRVKLEVRPATQPALANIMLSADATFFDLVRLAERLTQPGSGVVLQRVNFGPTSLGVEASALGPAS